MIINDKINVDVVNIRLVQEKTIYSEKQLKGPESVAETFGGLICNFDRECFCAINCETDLKPINFMILSIGSLNESIASPREVLKSAILSNANGIILMHNHPSNRVEPSAMDIATTRRMKDACDIMNIELYDHIIVGNEPDVMFSFKENGVVFKPRELSMVKEEKNRINL